MSESILTSVKKGVGGIKEDDTAFDLELIIYINTVLSTLTQVGIGPKAGYEIVSKAQTWADFMGSDPRLNLVKTYVILSVKLIFDPPTVGAVLESIKSKIAELEWRLNVHAESNVIEENQGG